MASEQSTTRTNQNSETTNPDETHKKTMMKNDNPTTGKIEIEADEERSHALLCALIDAKRKMEKRGHKRDERYLPHVEELQDEVADIYFADRE